MSRRGAVSRRALVLGVIAVVALGIRIAYVVTTGHASSMMPNEGEVAHNIVADGRWFVRNTRAEQVFGEAWERRHELIDPASVNLSRADRNGVWYPAITHPVGTSVVIAGLWALTGSERYIQVELLQGLVDGLAVLLVYWIAMQLFKRPRAALLAASAYALYPPIAWDAADPYDDIWAVDFTLAIVALYLLMTRSRHRWRWLVLCGLTAGIGAYFRPQVLLIAPALAIAMVAGTGWREALRRGLTSTLAALILLVPWTIRNYEDFHAFIPVRSGLWETMVGGLAELPNQIGSEKQAHRARPDLVPETPAWDSYLKQYFIRAVEQHPLFYLEVLVHRVGLATVLVHETIWMHRGAAGVLNHGGGLLTVVVHSPFVLAEYALPPAVFVLAMLALWLTWRRWKRQNVILVALALSILLPYIAMHVEARYLLPAVVVYFIWIGLGIDLLIERVMRPAPRASLA